MAAKNKKENTLNTYTLIQPELRSIIIIALRRLTTRGAVYNLNAAGCDLLATIADEVIVAYDDVIPFTGESVPYESDDNISPGELGLGR